MVFSWPLTSEDNFFVAMAGRVEHVDRFFLSLDYTTVSHFLGYFLLDAAISAPPPKFQHAQGFC